MKRFALPVAAVVAIVAVAALLMFLDDLGLRETGETQTQTGVTAVVSAPPPMKKPEKSNGDSTAKPLPAKPAATAPPSFAKQDETKAPLPPATAEPEMPKAAAEKTKQKPSFGIVRVNPGGDTVIAGSAQPGAEVTVSDKGKPIGSAKADKQGDWVVLPSEPLRPGDHELTAKSRTDADKPETEAQSKNKVIVVVPEEGKDVAGRAASGKTGALAMAVPREGTGGSVVLQKPGLPEKPAEPGKPDTPAGGETTGGSPSAGTNADDTAARPAGSKTPDAGTTSAASKAVVDDVTAKPSDSKTADSDTTSTPPKADTDDPASKPADSKVADTDATSTLPTADAGDAVAKPAESKIADSDTTSTSPMADAGDAAAKPAESKTADPATTSAASKADADRTTAGPAGSKAADSATTSTRPKADTVSPVTEPKDTAQKQERPLPSAQGTPVPAGDKTGPMARSTPEKPSGEQPDGQESGTPASQAANEATPGPTKDREDPSSKLSLDTVDYDDKGKVAVGGKAPEGSRVQLYLDNKPVGGADPDKTGVWRVELGDKVKPQRYRMRIDQIGPEGRVVARIESPFFPAGPITGLPRDAVVFVQPGNSLWRIARRTYGGGVQYTLIFEANKDQIRDPDLIYPGQVFVLPKGQRKVN